MNLVEKSTYNEHEHCIIKEELIISDESENELWDSIAKSTSDVDKNIYFRSENDERISSKTRDKECKRESKSSEDKLWDNVTKSTSNGGKKISLKSERDERYYFKKRDKWDTKASVKFIENHVKTYCLKCKEKRPVVIRKPKCLTCKAYLRYQCEKCLRSYSQYVTLRYHLQEKHLDGPTYTCKQCGKLFTLLKYKNRHQKHCGTAPMVSCSLCPYKSKYISNLYRHIKHKHPVK